METQTSTDDWRSNISDTGSATLKVLDGEEKVVLFLSEGKLIASVDFGSSIVFEVEHMGSPMNFYVKENNYSLLKQVKELGQPLTGNVAMISRTGSKKSDTRYLITKQEKI